MSLVTAKWTRSQRLRRTESCIALRHVLMAMRGMTLAAPAASAAHHRNSGLPPTISAAGSALQSGLALQIDRRLCCTKCNPGARGIGEELQVVLGLIYLEAKSLYSKLITSKN